MTTSTHTDDSRLSTLDCPAWVRADRAALAAWQTDKAWRKAARGALPPVHRAAGNGGTLGDQLLAQARRDFRRQASGERRQTGPDRTHAERCICPTCRKARGEYVPSERQQRQNREGRRVTGDQWRLSDEPRVVHTSTMDVVFESAGLSATGSGKMNWCKLRERFMDHLDMQAHHALLTLAEQRPRQARIVVCCSLLRLRQAAVARQEGICQQRVNQLLQQGLAFMRGCVISDDGRSVALQQADTSKSC